MNQTPSEHDPFLGKVIDGRYQILARIGEGGMGVVYKAKQVSVDRMVAIKMLNQQMAQDPNWVQRFYNEAKACSRLQHPNTIRMFDFGQTAEGRLFMSMEYLDGQSLRQAVATGSPMAPARVTKILIQCCASLAEAHSIGIIHRDIKPDNVFLLNMAGSPDFVKLLDFSVAKLLQEGDKMRTQAGVVFGTPQYMSPEQGRGLPLDARSDLYALGILAWEMLTGRVPFDDENPMAVLQMHLRQELPGLSDAVPYGVQQIVRRALDKDPGRRYQSAGEMMQHCQHVFGELGGGPISGAHAPIGGAPPPGANAPMMAAPRQAAPATGGAAQKTMIAGQPPPGFGGRPAAAGFGGNPDAMKTMVAGGPGGFGAAPPAAPAGGYVSAAPAQKTMMADLSAGIPSGPVGGPPPSSAPSAAAAPGPAKTMMLQPSEGIVSLAAKGVTSSAIDPAGAAVPAHIFGGEDDGPSLTFWIVSLLIGMAVGVGAYFGYINFK